MIRLVYFSQSIPTTTSGDLKRILASARRNNKESGVTGVLVTGGHIYLQILEGLTPAVLSLYLKILQDKRHRNVEILRVTPVKQRIFDAWSMACVEAAPLDIEQIIQFKAKYLALGEPQEFMDVMQGFMNVLRE
jgi:hypothetical protein